MTAHGLRRVLVRLLYAYWAAVIGIFVAGAVVLQTLGPPAVQGTPPPRAAAAPASAFAQAAVPPQPSPSPPAPTAATSAFAEKPLSPDTKTTAPEPSDPARGSTPSTAPRQQAHSPVQPAVATIRPGSDRPGPIAAPDPALLQPSPDDPVSMLPVISADGRAPMQVYARGFDATSRRPRVGFVFAGLGASEAGSYEAIRSLPSGVTLAFSPYSLNPARLLDLARTTGHEILLSLPLEPQGYPQNDAGDHSLLTGESPSVNTARLYWALGRFQGYAGATGALSTLRGERFANDQGAFSAMLRELARRGLFYVDPRPGAEQLPYVWNRSVDIVIDEPPVRTEIDAKLAQLEQIAREKGSALGLAGALRPVTVQRVQFWANGVQDRGLVLAPTSALMLPPAGSVAPVTPAPMGDASAPNAGTQDASTPTAETTTTQHGTP